MGKKGVEAGRGRPRVVKKGNAPDKRMFYAILAVVALAGVGLIAYLVSRPQAGVTTVDPNLPPPEAQGYVLGSPDAPVEIIEFADFECGACAQYAIMTAPDVKARLVNTGLARIRFYDFPLPNHRNSRQAHHAAACANDQGQFWPMHDLLYQNQDRWNTQATRNPKGAFEGYARQLSLDMREWERCYDDRRHERQIEANLQEGVRRRVNATPTFQIGSRMIPGAQSFPVIAAYVDSARAEAPPRAFGDTAAAVGVGGR
jgi:protein-disulfide isomerase